MCIDLANGRTWLQSLNTTAKCGTILLCHISSFRISHLPNFPPTCYNPRYCCCTDIYERFFHFKSSRLVTWWGNVGGFQDVPEHIVKHFMCGTTTEQHTTASPWCHLTLQAVRSPISLVYLDPHDTNM